MEFFLIDSERVKNCLAYIAQLPTDKKYKVSITQAKRSLNQNNLWHKWVDMVAKEAGTSPEDMKVILKRKILGLIEFADPTTGEIKKRDYSSADLDKEKFSRLMVETEMYAMEYFNMRLPTPLDLGMKELNERK